MIHSKNVTKEVIEKAKSEGMIIIEFENYDLSEEVRVNSLLRDWKKGKPEYKKFTFTKMYQMK